MKDSQHENTSYTLLARIQSGEHESWHRLTKLYQPLVCYWCKRSGLPEADTEDLVQEVWLAIGPTLKNFQPGAGRSFRGWLRGVTRHKLQDWHRRRSHQVGSAEGGSVALQSLEQIGAGEDESDDLSDPGEVSERQALYHRAIQQLQYEFEDKTWKAFYGVAIEAKTAAGVGTELGLSAAAVRMAKSRVLRRLRQELGDMFD